MIFIYVNKMIFYNIKTNIQTKKLKIIENIMIIIRLNIFFVPRDFLS